MNQALEWHLNGNATRLNVLSTGGEEKIQGYTSQLAGWAGRMMAGAFGTETVVPLTMTPSMFAVRLPIPSEWPTDAQQRCAGVIAGGLIEKYSMQVISFSVHQKSGNVTHWIRVSSQIYLEQQDFLALTHAVLTLRQSCKSRVGGLGSVVV